MICKLKEQRNISLTKNHNKKHRVKISFGFLLLNPNTIAASQIVGNVTGVINKDDIFSFECSNSILAPNVAPDTRAHIQYKETSCV